MADDPNPGAPNPDAIVPAAPAAPPAPAEATPPEHVPGYLRVWRAVWGTNPTPAHDGPPPPTDGTREIVETIVFVVVLVLMLRCFVAEAFVIPTGSMAETLYGYQKMVTCPQCEFFFPVNCSAEVEAAQEGGDPRLRATDRCICPNCRLNIALVSPGAPPDPSNTGQPIPDPGYSTGDRVLVAKFLYDLLGRMPNRLDVVVFKFPGDGDPSKGGAWPGTGPQQRGVPMNYIKRLVGLPGETIYIYRGDLYHSAVPDPKKWFDEDFRDCPDPNSDEHKQRKLQLWRRIHGGGSTVDYTHGKLIDPSTAEHKAILAEMKAGTIQIVRKPASVILAMRRIVYDNDHQAADLIKAQEPPRWQPAGAGWTADGTTFVGKAGETTAWLRYSNRLRGEKDPQLIRDFLGYNTDPHTGLRGGDQHWVKDLMLECEVDVAKAQGQFSLELSSGVDRFRAVWDLATGQCTLHRIQPHSAAFAATLGLEKGEVLGKAETKLKGPGKYRVRFANFDRQLVVWVDGALPFGQHGVAYEAPDYQDHKDFNDREQPASVGLENAEVTVRHLSLWRDVFYTNGQHRNPSDDNTGAIFQMYVQPDHYLCMGDNSPASSDGRSWGLVPNRLLLGKAQMVYYPFYFPWWPLKAPVNRVGLIR